MAEPGGLRPAGDRGSLTIADKVVERIATIAAGEVAETRDKDSAWDRALRRGLPKASAKVASGRARVHVDVAATWPTPLSTMAASVRDHVSERVSSLTGVAVTAVDVSVADIVQSHGSPRRVE